MPDEPEHAWTPFFKRAEALATAAFLTIPFAGPGLADYFNTVIVPIFTPPRDRAIRLLSRCLFGGPERAVKALLRLLPAPRPPAGK